MQNSQKSLMSVIILTITMIALLTVVGYLYIRPLAQTNQLSGNSENPTSKVYDIYDLGIKFTLPDSLSDLTYKVIKLQGDQAVNSVGFSSKRLEAAGCSAAIAPLGYLTYRDDKGGIVVGHVRGLDLYYLKPDKKCNADILLQDWETLQNALRSLVTDYVS